MRVKLEKEIRVQYMLPGDLIEAREKLPLIYLPVAPLEWHGPHMAVGMDALSAEQTAWRVAAQTGGVVLPTLYCGTERERPPEMLESLGFYRDDYVVGMDFPQAKGLYKSYYYREEIFALMVRVHLEQCIEHGYKYIYIVNGHGAFNHNEVLQRLCIEFSNSIEGVKVAFSIAFPQEEIDKGAIGHADCSETSLLMYFDQELVDLERLPSKEEKMKYKDFSIVDNGGFAGEPGEGHAISDERDPRLHSSAEYGEEIFNKTVSELVEKVKNEFGIN